MRKKYKKPFVAQFGDVSASGGYYLAAACDKIVAHPGTLLGSIGVIFSHRNIEGLFGKLGIRSKPIKSGKMVILIRQLTDEYFAAVTMRPDGNFGKARFLLRISAPKILQDL